MTSAFAAHRPDRATPATVRHAIEESGEPLPAALRGLCGPGSDLSRVRVHSDPSALAVRAQAYTVGSHVVFAPGRYRPGTEDGRRLLAHELTHVLQQRGSAAPSGDLRIGRADEPAEREADAVADTAMTGTPIGAQVLRHPQSSPRVQRKDDDRVEPHYPSAAEQAELTELMKRDPVAIEPVDTRAAPATAPTTAPATVARSVAGRRLSEQQRQGLVGVLLGPLLSTLQVSAGGRGRTPRISPAEGFAIIQHAQARVLKQFGAYVRREFTLTEAERASPDQPSATKRVPVSFTDPGTDEQKDNEARSLIATTFSTGCEACTKAMAGVDRLSRLAVLNGLIGVLLRDHRAEMHAAALAQLGGGYSPATDSIRIAPAQAKADLPDSAAHEVIHAYTHQAFRAAFGTKNKNVIEGFTNYFTEQVVGHPVGDYATVTAAVTAMKGVIEGPFRTGAGPASAEESLRLAYFAGRLDLIGWVPSDAAEAEAVRAAGGSMAWSPDEARRLEAGYRDRAIREQTAKRNVLGVGLYLRLPRSGDPTIAVRYARVLARLDPYAKWQVQAEGQLLAQPVGDSRGLGGSLGVALEYQEPYFYVSPGVRFVGTGVAGSSATRLDVSPFLTAGVRAWRPVRIGAEAFGLLPVYGGGEKSLGAGVTVGFEFD